MPHPRDLTPVDTPAVELLVQHAPGDEEARALLVAVQEVSES